MFQALEEHILLLACAAFAIAFLCVCWIHPYLVKLALMKGIVDAPNIRKLQRVPVPVLGGVAVFLGVVMGLGCLSPFLNAYRLLWGGCLMTLMLYIGTLDDVMGLSPRFRFLVEILSVLVIMFVGKQSIGHFHGLWGIGEIPLWGSLPLTLFGVVGIINAINLIDGVNGLSSGYCVMASAVFAVFFHYAGDITMMLLATVCAGAVIPFFVHNVFGNKSRMFIGDGGTLLMGMVMSIFVTRILSSDFHPAHISDSFGLIPFTLAVLSIPVFDTLRVMSSRIISGRSPFRPDKTHLHHLFIEIGFSHPGTTFCILTLNSLVIALWGVLAACGVSVDVQLYAVIAAGMACTFGLYFGVKALSPKGRAYRFLRRVAIASHVERKGLFLWVQRWVDRV